MSAASSPALPPVGPPPGPVERAARWMSRLLRAGLVVAVVMIAGAMTLLVAENPGSSSSRVTAARTVAGYLGGNGLGRGLLAGSPEAYLTVGIYVLVAVPIFRVASGVYYFRLAGEREMARIISVVLGMLLLSLLVVGPLVR